MKRHRANFSARVVPVVPVIGLMLVLGALGGAWLFLPHEVAALAPAKVDADRAATGQMAVETSTGTASTPTRTTTATPCASSWSVAPVGDESPALGSDYTLSGVAALSANDIWAVGYYYSNAASAYRTRILHYTNGAWQTISSPNPGIHDNRLMGVTALPSGELWAVGDYEDNIVQPVQTLTLHYTGGQWQVVPSPNVGTGGSHLTSVSRSWSNEVWAVGYYTDVALNAAQTLTVHYTGGQWQVVPSPNASSSDNYLVGVALPWAVGYYRATATSPARTLLLEYNGSNWQVWSSPNPGTGENYLQGIVQPNAYELWAVGYYTDAGSAAGQTLTLHYNAGQWQVVPSPNLGTDGSYLYGVTAANQNNDLWAVGRYYDAPSNQSRTLTMHYTGGQNGVWQIVPSPNPSATVNYLLAVAALVPGDIWAVGTYGDAGFQRSLTLHYSSVCTTPTPVSTSTTTPTGTSTPTVTTPPTITPTTAPSATPTATPTCGLRWRYVPSPNGASYDNYLYAISARTPSDIWAVGHAEYAPMTMHWDGTTWSTVPAPTLEGVLDGVAAVGPDDVWAVGYHTSGGYPGAQLLLHWDSTSWNIVPISLPGAINELRSIAALGPSNIWIVGYSSGVGSLILHWDGSTWSMVDHPGPPGATNLIGITALSANDIWAVGGWYQDMQHGGLLALHWDGTTWTYTPMPGGSAYVGAGLLSVAGSGPDDVWAVGTGSESVAAVAVHWDGTQWSLVSPRSPGDYENILSGVAALSSNDAWAVGRGLSMGNRMIPLLEHWDGSQWSVVQIGDPNAEFEFAAVASFSPTDIWVVGRKIPPVSLTLTYHYYDPCSASTPTPTPSLTPSATAFATPYPTAYVTPSATPCALSFSDVPEGSTFYPYVRCLACRGILGGYNDNTFRPASNITRGQIAKIVSNAAAFGEDVTGLQTYTDVPSTQTFWVWIERLTQHQVMSGYNCGGQGEPCDSAQRPYFRPGNNATRGQLSKIVSNAALFTEQHNTQSFADVPTTDTFYQYIERLASRGVIGGYQCGAQGEPCDPQQRPYFRPGNNVTRGQASKIVANTFYSDCQTP